MFKMRTRHWANRGDLSSGVIAINDTEEATLTRENSYAKCKDFRNVFLANLDSLYQLGILLAGDPHKAEQFLISAFDDCARTTHVFKEWALPWAKRTVIQHAARALQSSPNGPPPTSCFQQRMLNSSNVTYFSFNTVLSLQPLERFAFVVSVLERYSIRDCACLLGCLVEDVRHARARAVEQIAATAHVDPAGEFQVLNTAESS